MMAMGHIYRGMLEGCEQIINIYKNVMLCAYKLIIYNLTISKRLT